MRKNLLAVVQRPMLFAWLLLGCLSLSVRAQDRTGGVTGIVRNDQGDPLPGISVLATNSVTGLSSGAQTDTAGIFTFTKLPITGRYNFTFSGVGFQQQTLTGYILKADASTSIIVKLKNQTGALSEVVVVGYGTQKRVNLTGAVAQVSGDVLDRRSIPNLTQGLQGLIPNLNLITTDGKPVSSAVYNIRGATSIGQGGSALVLIDGIQGDPSLLNPNDVASVTVLKDAASAAIYGARAAFGVVLITTKTPSKGRATITYSSNYSIKSPTTVPKIESNGYKYMLMFDSAWTGWNDYSQIPAGVNKTQKFSQAYLTEYARRNGDPSLPKADIGPDGNYVYYGNTNWYDLLYKKHNAAIDQNLSISGSSGKASYYVTGRYYGQDGIFRYNSDDYHMYNLTAKGNIEVLPWLQVYNYTQYTTRDYHNPVNVGEGGGIWRNMADEAHPSSMLQNPDGTLTFSAAYTVGDLFYGKNGINFKSQVLRNTTGFVAKFMDNKLRIKGDFTFQNTDSSLKQIRVQVPYSVTPGVIAYVGTTTNDMLMGNAKTQYLATNIYGEYENTFGGDHYFKAMIGYNYEQSVFNNFNAQRNGIVYSNATDLSLALGQNITTAGGYEKWAILGGFGRLNYGYKDRYLLEVNGRYDGSSKFPSDQRFGFFPSVSAGWRIAKEAFWNVDPKAISDIKIRGSYGSLGNGSIASYNFQELFKIYQSGRVINGVRPQATSQPNVLPEGLTWEKATTKDLGLDVSALDNKLTFTADIYARITTNMFTVGKTLPAVFGTTLPKGNYADMRTTGWEASISWRDQFNVAGKPLHYNVGFWMSDNQSTITRYNNANKVLTDYYEGQKLGEIWGYTNDGFWTAADDPATNGPKFQPIFKASNTGKWLPGDLKFKDLSKDNMINNGANTVKDHGDLRIIGNSTPRYTYGINLNADYAGFFVGAFFQGVGKQNWWPGSEADVFWGQFNRPYNFLFKYQEGKIWSPENPNTYFPRYRGYTAQNSQGELYNPQTRYLQNVAYIRLKNVQVGYNLPNALVQRLKLSGVRFYVSGENLWTYSPLFKLTRDIDPESIGKSDIILTGTTNNGNGNNYPILKSVTLGLNVTL
ncbi:TonB-dependent receptor [Flavitalea sp. BT771]|uniref:SusC/RagA family TonB-linked outer membrane protein n=1 Tax=Flavitalea sp. BT771 TaxID=3063329 RepID=UPI0026E3F1B1|nr:TonB-dependent receptor [Flavitalea sp. BT771]MDO6434931.1 TonB-dependent receptor [Flavitalea sp. BT771]MDV6223831.1 TonB-dependent receptor [Flavitalea sp. BT771]